MFLFIFRPPSKSSVVVVSDDVAVIFGMGVFFVFCHVPLSLLLIRGIFSQAVVIRVQYSTPEPVLRVALERISGLANSFLPLVKSVMIHFKYPKRIKN